MRSDISASPFFAEQGIPLLIEKLTASSGAVKVIVLFFIEAKLTKTPKRDALLSIADALPVYGPGQVSLKSRKLWDAISIEVGVDTSERYTNATPRYSIRQIWRQKMLHSSRLNLLSERCIKKLSLPIC